jgi:hypothetical protein
MIKKPLWDYLEAASYVRPWSPGKMFVGFNVTLTTLDLDHNHSEQPRPVFGDFKGVSRERLQSMSLDHTRQLVPYDAAFHSHRAVFFPGHEKNRLLTHW